MFLPENHEIFKAYDENRLAIFIGAGLSLDFGLPTWQKLSNNLLKQANELNYISDELYEYYTENFDNKKIISVVKESFKENNDLDSFNKFFKNELQMDENHKRKLLTKTNNYSMLYDFFNREDNGFHGLFLTTNADLCLDYFFNNGIVNKPDDLSMDFEHTILYHFRNEKIIHLHGSINNMESLVFTQEEYNDRYSNEKYQKLLQIIFNEFTVLFIGYSLGDYELLSNLINCTPNNKKHYLLSGYPSKYMNKLCELEQKSFYEHLKIEVIPFKIEDASINYEELIITKKDEEFYINHKCIINKDFSDLFNKIKDLMVHKEIIEKPFDDQNSIIQLINNSKNNPNLLNTNGTTNYIRNIISEDKYSNFLFEELIKNDIPKEWYDFFYKNDLLNICNKRINVTLLIRFIFNLSKKEYVNDEFKDSFKKIIDNLLKFSPKVKNEYYLNLIFKTLLNMDNDNFDENYAIIGLEIFKKCNDFINYVELKNMLKKLYQKKYFDVINNYHRFILSFQIDGWIIRPYIDQELLNIFLNKYIEDIPTSELNKLIKLFIKNIKFILNKGISDVITSIYYIDEDESFNQEYLHNIVKSLKKSLVKIDKNLFISYVKKFYSCDDILFNRIAFYLIDKNYSLLKEIIWTNDKNPLNVYSAHEFSKLLDFHGKKLDNYEIEKMNKWIADCENFYNTSDEKIINSIKKGWYDKLDDSNPIVNKEIEKFDPSLESYDYSIIEHYNVTFGFPSSYLPDFQNKSNKEICKYILNEELNEIELKESLRDLLDLEPNRLNDIMDFKSLPDNLQSLIIFKLSDEKIFENIKNHDIILDYIYQINLKNKYDYNGIFWYLKKYISLKNSVNKEKIERILLKILETLNNYSNYHGELQYDFLNEPLSLLYDVMMLYLYKNKTKSIQKIINRLLNDNPHNELKYYLGKYTPLIYKSKKDFKGFLFKKIIKHHMDIHFLRGLLSWPQYISNELYEYLTENNSLNINFIEMMFNSEIRQKYPKIFIIFIIFNVLYRNQERLMDMLIEENITNNELEIIINIILPRNITDKTYPNFIKIWEKILSNTNDKRILKKLNQWIRNINKIDVKTFKLLKKSVKFVDERNCYMMMTYYQKLVEESPEYVGKLLLEQKVICPENDFLKYIIETMKIKNEQRLANTIIKKYEEKNPEIYHLFN